MAADPWQAENWLAEINAAAAERSQSPPDDICPNCGGECYRESVDVEVGIIHGPWGCPMCGWSESREYDQTAGPTYSESGYRTDQYGWLYPTQRREADHA